MHNWSKLWIWSSAAALVARIIALLTVSTDPVTFVASVWLGASLAFLACDSLSFSGSFPSAKDLGIKLYGLFFVLLVDWLFRGGIVGNDHDLGAISFLFVLTFTAYMYSRWRKLGRA
ncbi:hypothetical protein [Stenotrophomonas pigmentata]|uniref:hypothetical protein n=1 Tax=Stenotrophomonas pigmentata TaxID=3055080 RepID=UPI0026EC782F|nr:hypothetical protein [Stenotrophomonas sp. 610A2]